MDQKKLAIWLKAIVVGCALCGLALFGFILPRYLAYAAEEVPDLPHTAWNVFMWVLAVPCYAVWIAVLRTRSTSRSTSQKIRCTLLPRVLAWL